MIARAVAALALLIAGMLAVLVGGGTAADAAGPVAILAALAIFSRGVFRVAEGGVRSADRTPGTRR